MPQTIAYKKTKSHFDDEANWNPANSGHGTDTHTFVIPAGNMYARYSVDFEVASAGSGAIVESSPRAGTEGEQSIQVRWWYNPFGKVRYVLTVYAGALEPVSIYHGESNWSGKTLDAIRQGQDVNLSGRGPIAKKLFGRLMRMSSNEAPGDFSKEPAATTISVPRDVAFGLISTVKYGALGGILLLAHDSGYEVRAKYDPHGALSFDDELILKMKKG